MDVHIASQDRFSTLYWVLPWLMLVSFTLVCILNQVLNRKALNHGEKASFDWTREIVLITGGSGGIGGATVQEMAKKGTRIVLLDVLPLTYNAPSNVHYYKCDLMNYTQLQEVATTIKQDIGDPTVIVANAGIYRGKPILHASQRDIELTFGVNTIALIWTIKTFLPDLVARNHGHLLIVSSQTGYATTSCATDYSASKAAALSIYEGLHTEIKHIYKAPAVRISCICPSHVQTGMFKGIKSVPGMSTMTAAYVAKKIADILHSGRAQHSLVPMQAGLSPWMRVLPSWMRVAAQDVAAAAFKDVNPHDPFEKLD